MEKEVLMRDTKKSNWVIYLSSSILLTLFLLYIDEGENNFEWINDPLNWLSFIVYSSGIIGGQFLFEKRILKRYSGNGKLIISAFGGLVVGVPIIFLLFLITFLLGKLF